MQFDEVNEIVLGVCDSSKVVNCFRIYKKDINNFYNNIKIVKHLNNH